MKEKKMLVFTSEYPYGESEVFIENEESFLPSSTIFCPCNLGRTTKRVKRANYKVINGFIKDDILIKVFYSIFYLPYIMVLDLFRREVEVIIESKKNVKCLVTAYSFVVNALVIKRRLERSGSVVNCTNIMLYNYWYSYSTLACVLLKRKEKNKHIVIITRAHGFDVYEERNRNKYQPYKKIMSESVDKIYAISKGTKHYLEETFGIESSKVEVSYIGTYGGRKINSKLQSRGKKLISCANMISLKRINLLIEALSFVKSDFVWHHFGTGPLFPEISNLCKQLLSPKTYQLYGYQQNAAIHQAYIANAYEYYISFSSTEGLPVSYMEAMSYGVPVISTNVGSVGEIIKNGINGCLVDENIQPREFAMVLDHYLSLKNEEYWRLSQNAYSMWKVLFNAQENFSVFYRRLNNLW